jgi:flavin-dependent dehydrogenase
MHIFYGCSRSEMTDVVIVGARCAGSPLAMLLARMGYKVMVLDASRFPSDTLSTHQIWPLGVAALHRWGLWREIAAADPGICHSGLNRMPGGTLKGPWHAVQGIDYTINLRRVKLDWILIQAARAAGAEVREGIVIDGLLYEGGQCVGVSGHDRKTNTRFSERARIVIGADGHRSTIARLTGAQTFDETPTLTVTYYMYVSDLPGDRDMDEIYTCPPREYLFSPTDGGLTVVNLVMSKEMAAEFRRDVNKNFQQAFDLEPELGERLRAARTVGHIRGVLDQPNFYRRSYGEGWALVGDAAYCKDPIRAQGITDAFLDAEKLAESLDDAFSGRTPITAALADCEAERKERTAFPYRLCLNAARFELATPKNTRRLLGLIENRPDIIAEMRGLICGSVRPDEFFDTQHLALMGIEAVGAGAWA